MPPHPCQGSTVDFCRPVQFEAEGIDGMSNVQKVDLRTAPRIEAPHQEQRIGQQQSSVVNESFYDSEEDDEEHQLGSACCPGRRNVVFRVY